MTSTNANRAIRQKIARLQEGGKPRVLDLFSGCGGISLGFSAAGFAVSASVEFDHEAAASHGRNFHAGDPATMTYYTPTHKYHWMW